MLLTAPHNPLQQHQQCPPGQRERWTLEEEDGSSTEKASGLTGSGWVDIPKARVLHRVWGGRFGFGRFVLELLGEGGEPVFAEGLLENSSLWWDGFHLESTRDNKQEVPQ